MYFEPFQTQNGLANGTGPGSWETLLYTILYPLSLSLTPTSLLRLAILYGDDKIKKLNKMAIQKLLKIFNGSQWSVAQWLR